MTPRTDALPGDDVSCCVRAFVDAALRGFQPKAESFVEGYFAYRESASAERLVASVMRALESLTSETAARTCGISPEQWAAFQALEWEPT